MESIGDRIARLRGPKGWSRAQLGREMAKAITRPKPFTGEVVRLYETGKNDPGADAIKALALVFKRPESYIQFGVDARAKTQDADLSDAEQDLIARYRRSDPRWQLSLRLLAEVATEEKIDASDVDAVLFRVRKRTLEGGTGRKDKKRGDSSNKT